MDLIKLINSKIDERAAVGNDNSFYILDLADVRLKYQNWIKQIPRVTPFYAVKCNDDPSLVKFLSELGTGFDCASIKEVNQISEMDVDPNRIIYANTVKQASHLQLAAKYGVEMVTFDCPAELDKIKNIHPNAKLVLRIKFDADNVLVNMGTKFGCDPITEAPALIKKCKDMGMNLIGISFHVGSGTLDHDIYERALQSIRELFDVAESLELKLNFVDIGGGFLVNDFSLLSTYANYINKGIEQYFSDPSVTIISEPGRYFADSAFSLVVQVILKKICNDGHRHYYINDSISQSFISTTLWKQKLQYKFVRKSQSFREYPSTIWGQTCNSLDAIIRNRVIPELEMGDHIVFVNMGAYTRSMASNFNGFNIGEVIVIGNEVS